MKDKIKSLCITAFVLFVICIIVKLFQNELTLLYGILAKVADIMDPYKIFIFVLATYLFVEKKGKKKGE